MNNVLHVMSDEIGLTGRSKFHASYVCFCEKQKMNLKILLKIAKKSENG